MLNRLKILKLLHFNKKENLTMGKYFPIYNLLCLAYKMIIRSILLKAIDDPTEEFDDIVMSLMDKLFNYEAPK